MADNAEGEEVYQETQHGRPSRSRVDPETLSYLQEIDEHFGTLTDDEERQLLVSRVIEELQGARTCPRTLQLHGARDGLHDAPQAPAPLTHTIMHREAACHSGSCRTLAFMLMLHCHIPTVAAAL